MLSSKIGASGRLNPASCNSPAEKIVVAIKAERQVSKEALAWALTHVVRPGDCITLLAVFSGKSTGSPFTSIGRRLWNLPKFGGNCAGVDGENLPDRICEISESCSQMILQYHNQIQVKVNVKVLLGMLAGEVAAEAKRNGASWVILDKKLKQEQKHCLEELNCSIVVMKGSQPQVLRLNLGYSGSPQTPFLSASSSPAIDCGRSQSQRILKHATPVSSPDYASSSYSRTTGEVSFSSYDVPSSPFLVYEQNPLFEGLNRGKHTPTRDSLSTLDSQRERLIYRSNEFQGSPKNSTYGVAWIPETHNLDQKTPLPVHSARYQESKYLPSRFASDKFVPCAREANNVASRPERSQPEKSIHDSSIRDAVSLARTSSAPPPLCSLCQHKAPAFGKPPRRFTYEELQEATHGFSDMSLLAEGGCGLVHRGVLKDGQVIAVKQLKFAGSQADADFCREVRVLSCAQHRNVVMLIGFCIEGSKRVLVYEYICNGSLEFHLHGSKKDGLDLQSRLRLATSAARGLRYLHEDCRVGCIIHRDMRPSNILVTHDFEALVGDFGLARLNSEWDITKEQQVVGVSGYLAPEYFDGGNITEKVDVYAFGVVLVELITSQKVKDLRSHKGWSSLVKWFDPLAGLHTIQDFAGKGGSQFVEPRFSLDQVPNFPPEIQAMGRAACLCLRRDPESRPPMSKILRILEGGNTSVPLGLDLNSAGTRSGHMQGLTSCRKSELKKCHSRKLSQ